MIITHDAWELIIQGSFPSPKLPEHVQTCSTWTSLCRAPPLDMFKLIHYEVKYGRQTGGWHPTGVYTCVYLQLSELDALGMCFETRFDDLSSTNVPKTMIAQCIVFSYHYFQKGQCF